MKKYIIMCMAVVALLFASCKNEDISISREVSFDINPKSVVIGFTEDFWGDIADIPSDGMLRTRLLIYNADGQLIQSTQQDLSGYDDHMSATVQLPDGAYRAIVITDIARNNTNIPEYWTLSGENDLSSMKLYKAGYITKFNMLGIANLQFTVEVGSPKEYTINVEPAGTLLLCIVYGIHHYDEIGIQYYELLTNRTSESCAFNSDGTWKYSIKNSNFENRFAVFYSQDYNYGGYFYDFELPLGNTSLKWTADGEVDVTNKMDVAMKAGEEYEFVLDLDEGTYNWGVINGGKGSSFRKDSGEMKEIVFEDYLDYKETK